MKKILIMMAILMMPMAMHAETQAQIIAKINKATASVKTMQCDFVQTKYLKMLNDKMVSKGKMYYQQSDKLHWEYTTPYKYTFILNGTKVLIKNNGKNDVIDVKQNKMFQQIAAMMMSSVSGKCLSDSKDFQVSIVQKGNEYVATLTPLKKTVKQMFPKIVIHFSISGSQVSLVELYEKNGDRTEIRMQNVVTNKPINASVFSIN